MNPTGLLVIDKPAGMTSHQVVAAVRKALATRKVGHAGTLDPMATGVLLVGVGRATRLLGHLALKDKAYATTIRLGASTVTDDAEGELLLQAEPDDVESITAERIRAGISALTGEILQVPTAVSAIKVDGQRAYARVRAGEQVELKARPVTVSRFEVRDIRRLDGFVDVDADIECTTGTYVRALARDLGAGLGVGGHLTALRRTRVGPWGISEATSLAALAADASPDTFLIDLDETARRSLPTLTVDHEGATAVGHGRRVDLEVVAPTALLDPAGHLIAIAEPGEGGLRYAAVFVGQGHG